MADQDLWYYCKNCAVIHWAGSSERGMCVHANNGPHVAQGFNFNLPNNIPEAPFTQPGWRFCSQCYGLFYSQDASPQGRCAKGGPHRNNDKSPADFVLPQGLPVPPNTEPPGMQRRWFYCTNCHLMNYGPADGHCIAEKDPSGGVLGHVDGNGSVEFFLPHKPKASGWID